MYKLLTASLVGLFMNCHGNQTDQTNTTASSDSSVVATSLTPQCYAYASARDTVALMLTQSGAHVTGDLLYKLAGKDQNTGTIDGTLHGDTLLADYTFFSEGTQSVREVAFLRQNNGYVEGYGPVRQQNTRQTFADHAKLTFDSRRPLRSIPCPQ